MKHITMIILGSFLVVIALWGMLYPYRSKFPVATVLKTLYGFALFIILAVGAFLIYMSQSI